MQDNKVAAWNGEFGPVYAAPSDVDAETINQERYHLLGTQLKIYDKYQIPWSIWLYKDIGIQGMVHTSPTSLYQRTISPFLQKKRELQLDAWGKHPSAQVSNVIDPLVKWIDSVCPQAKETYPTPWHTQRHVVRATLECFLARAFAEEFANLFKDLSLEELDEAAQSFKFENCVQRGGLNKIMSEHAAIHRKE